MILNLPFVPLHETKPGKPGYLELRKRLNGSQTNGETREKTNLKQSTKHRGE
jgi:hypothetical protein